MFTSFLQSSPIESPIPQALSLAGPQRPSRQRHIERCTLPPAALKPAQDNANHDRPWHIVDIPLTTKDLRCSTSLYHPINLVVHFFRYQVAASQLHPPTLQITSQPAITPFTPLLSSQYISSDITRSSHIRNSPPSHAQQWRNSQTLSTCFIGAWHGLSFWLLHSFCLPVF